MYRIVNQIALKPLAGLFPVVKYTYHTRRQSIVIAVHTWQKFNVSFLVKAIMYWDSLPIDIKNKDYVRLFSQVLKAKLISTY